MGSIFGYVGRPMEGLLDGMAERLSHRSKKMPPPQIGVETIKLDIAPQYVVEIGHGIPQWCGKQRVFVNQQNKQAWGYSGVIFNPAPLDSMLNGGEEALKELTGSFVMACAHQKKFYLLRDAAGIKGLYWYRHKERLLFASEIKALFADPMVEREIRTDALPEYLTFSFIPGRQTMFKGIEELQPGHMLTFENNQVGIQRHFYFEHLEPEPGEQEPIEHQVRSFRRLLEQSVHQCCESTEQTPGIFLSGGIDSSAVLAVMANLYPGKPINTFSVHFGSNYANENDFISMMVEKYRTRHTWLEIKPGGFIKRLKEIIYRLDDPIGDPITVPNYLLAETASQVTNVILNGEGGDPCFGGPKNIPMMLSQLYGPAGREDADNWSELNYLRSYRKCYSDLEELLNPDLFSPQQWQNSLQEILHPFFKSPQPRAYINKLMTINIRLKGANLILIKVDKMTSANGVLALAPLFSKEVIQAGMGFAPTLKLNGNVEKHILKMAVKDILPEPIIQRPKCGMMVPVRFWFQEDMKRYAKRLLSKRKLKNIGFFNPDYVRRLLKYNLNDIHGMRYGTKLWMLITFILWHEQMVEGNY